MIGLKSNTLHYVKDVHFWGRFANLPRLANRPQKCKKGAPLPGLTFLGEVYQPIHFYKK